MVFKKILEWLETAPRWKTFLIFFAIIALYAPINHFPIFEPQKLPFLFGENTIPFFDWTTSIYFSFLVYVPLAFYLIPSKHFSRTFLALCFLCLLHFFIFIFFPTFYHRPDTGFALFELFKFIDASTNCFPSLHVSLSLFFAIALLRTRGDRLSIVFFFWAILITLSTITTKQHYVLDILGAILTSCVASLLI